MKPNENSKDRAARVILGIAALVAASLWLGLMDGAVIGIVAAIVGVVLIGTGVVGFCPGYRILGVSTCAVNPAGTTPPTESHN